MLKTLRLHRKLTQAQLARLAQTSQPYIACLERGGKKNPSLAVLGRLAKAMGMTIGALVDEMSDPLK